MTKWGARLGKFLPHKSPGVAEPLDFLHLQPVPFEHKDPALVRPKRVAFEAPPTNGGPTPSKNVLETEFHERGHKRQKNRHPLPLTPHPLHKPLIEEDIVARHDVNGGRCRRGNHRRHHTPNHTPTKLNENDTPEYAISCYASGRDVVWNWNVLNHPNMAIAFHKEGPPWRPWTDLRTLVIQPPVLHIHLILHPSHRSAKVFEKWPSIHVHAKDATRGITLFDMFLAIYTYLQQPCSKTEIDHLAGLDEQDLERQLSLAQYRLKRTNQDLPREVYWAEMGVGLRRKHFLYHGKTMFEKIEPVPGACVHTYYLSLTR